MARVMISATVFAIAFARSSARTFTVVNDWNAIPSGRHTTAESLSHCEKLCDVPCTQWAFNLHSNHCYTSENLHFGGSKSDHVVSGCIAGLVKGCPPAPTPAPAPSPNPSPAHLPIWSVPRPDPKKPLGGYSKLNVTWVSKIHHGDRDPPLGHGNGTYNHNVMAAYAEGSGFAVSWKNCQTDEDCNGQRILISLSVDGTPGTWSKVPLLLFPNLTVDGGPQATMEPGPPVHINGRLYFAGSPGLHNTTHDASAQGSQFCLWPDPLEPRNCGPPSNVAVQYVDTLLMREVKLGKDFGTLGPLFWASEHGPSLFAKSSAALGIPSLADMDAQTRQDILSLGNATAPTPSCSAPGTTKCEACAGGCQLQNTIPYDLGIANERTHLVAPNGSFDTLLYRAQNHVLWASTRPLDVATGTASQLDWSPVAPTDIPNDNSNVNAGTLPNGRIYLVHNPVTPAKKLSVASQQTGSHPSGRDPITVATSPDGVDFDRIGVVMTCTTFPDQQPDGPCKPRWEGKSKNPGPSYPQAIAVTSPPDLAAFYVVASCNKEDIWIARLEYSNLP